MRKVELSGDVAWQTRVGSGGVLCLGVDTSTRCVGGRQRQLPDQQLGVADTMASFCMPACEWLVMASKAQTMLVGLKPAPQHCLCVPCAHLMLERSGPSLLAAGSMDGSLSILDASTGSCLCTHKTHSKYLIRVVWVPGQALCVTASQDQSVAVHRFVAAAAGDEGQGELRGTLELLKQVGKLRQHKLLQTLQGLLLSCELAQCLRHGVWHCDGFDLSETPQCCNNTLDGMSAVSSFKVQVVQF